MLTLSPKNVVTFITRKISRLLKMVIRGSHHSSHKFWGSTWGGLTSEAFWERTPQVLLSRREVRSSFMLSCREGKWVG